MLKQGSGMTIDSFQLSMALSFGIVILLGITTFLLLLGGSRALNGDSKSLIYHASRARHEVGDFGGDRPRRAAGRFIASAINEARIEFGLVTECEANRLMVRKFLRDKMKEHGVRPTHIALHLDTAVSLFFVPLDRDVRNRALRNTPAVNAQFRAYRLADWSWLPYWGSTRSD